MRLNPSIDKDNYIYRALVVNNQDTKKLGRVQVRIPCFHGDKNTGIPDKDLPWASLCMMGASPQSGSFIVPEAGSIVWVLFENGNHTTPVVLGGVYSAGTAEVRTLDQSPSTYSADGRTRTTEERSGRMVPAYQHDVMEEARVDTSTRVLYKSPKGAHVMVRDKDKGESIEIRDANGQMLKLTSPMDPVKTKDNKHKYKKPKDNLIARARMLLTNNLGQFFSIFSDGNSADIDLIDILSHMGIEIDGNEKRCRFFNHSGEKVEIIMKDDSIAMQSEGAFVEISGGKVVIKGASVEIESPEVTLNGSSVNLSGEVNVNGSQLSQGTEGSQLEAPVREIKEWEEEV